MIRKFKHKEIEGITADLDGGKLIIYFNDKLIHIHSNFNYELSSNWIEITKPIIFEDDEWLYCESDATETLLRFNGINKNKCVTTNEFYQVVKSGGLFDEGTSENYVRYDRVSKATDKQIFRILKKVAIHKGYKNGDIIKYDVNVYACKIESNEYSLNVNGLKMGENFVYNNDYKWVKIVWDDADVPPLTNEEIIKLRKLINNEY